MMGLERAAPDSGGSPSDAASSTEHLVALSELTLPELRTEWDVEYGTEMQPEGVREFPYFTC